MNTIDKLREKLKKYPDAKYEVKKNSITYLPHSENGFAVSLDVHSRGYTVSYDGWHEEFLDEQEALNCFGFGLSESCRLKILQRGKMRYKWILQFKTEQGWQSDSETGLIFFPFWLRKKERYLQNHIIE